MLLIFGILLYASSIVNALLYPLIFVDRVYNYTPPEDEVTFFLYHREDLTTSDQIFIGDEESLKLSKFDVSLPTKIIIHGWSHGRNVPWLVDMREAMANVGLWNIIVVDWAPLSHVIYVEARVHNLVVSNQVTNLLLFLSKFVLLSSVHLIGHSMGAQIAALAGYNVKTQLKQAVGRITGLDPAAPLYEYPHIESLSEVLDYTDADFVDVIHTNARHLGMITPAGHVDYYPDGGEQQDGCILWSCSHLRACEFWTASIKKPDLFKAYSFKSLQQFNEGEITHLEAYPMGIAASQKIPFGIYYVEAGNDYEQYVTTKTTIFDSTLFAK